MRSLLFNFLNILFLFHLSYSVSAQPGGSGPPTGSLGTVTNGGEGTGGKYGFCLDEGNQMSVKVNVLLDGLQIIEEGENIYGVIPGIYPDMYVEFTIYGINYYVAVGNFELVTLENGHLTFSFVAESPVIDFSEECDNLEEDFISDLLRYRLVTFEDDSYITYPACDFPELFTCNVYPHAPWCSNAIIPGFGAPDDPSEACYNEWFSGGFVVEMYCDCGDDTPIPPDDTPVIHHGSSFNNEGGDHTNRTAKDLRLHLYPNPMGQWIQVESNKESIRKIEVYNTSGDLMIKNIYASEDNLQVSLNTSELPFGMYLVRIATDSGVAVIKVFK